MKFEDALKAMRDGKKVATHDRFYRRYFVDALYIDCDRILMWHCVDDEDYSVEENGLTGDEIMSDDWEIVE